MGKQGSAEVLPYMQRYTLCELVAVTSLHCVVINTLPKLTVRVRFPSPAPRFPQLNALINDQSDLPSWMFGADCQGL